MRRPAQFWASTVELHVYMATRPYTAVIVEILLYTMTPNLYCSCDEEADLRGVAPPLFLTRFFQHRSSKWPAVAVPGAAA